MLRAVSSGTSFEGWRDGSLDGLVGNDDDAGLGRHVAESLAKLGVGKDVSDVLRLLRSPRSGHDEPTSIRSITR